MLASLLAASAWSQSTGNINANGNCIASNTGTNSKITQTCMVIDPELFKQFKMIADQTKQNQNLLSGVLARTSQILAFLQDHSSNPPVINNQQSCPGGICGESVTGTNTVINKGPLPPQVSWTQQQQENKPSAVDVRLSVDHSMEIPAFIASCDRPCTPGLVTYWATPTMGVLEQVKPFTTPDPKIVGIVMMAPRPYGVGPEIVWTIRSLDNQPFKIIALEPLAQDVAVGISKTLDMQTRAPAAVALH